MKLFNYGILLIITTVIVTTACNSQTVGVKEKSNRVPLAKPYKNHVTKNDSVNATAYNIAIKRLPFGSNLLVTYKFPKSWTPTDYDSDSVRIMPDDKVLFKIMQECEKLNTVTAFKGPKIIGKNFIPLGGDSSISKYRRVFDDDFRYRLPNIDKYVCYYVYHPYNYDENAATTPIVSKVAGYYTNMGSLILYDRENQSGNVINVTFNLSFFDNYYHVDRFFGSIPIAIGTVGMG